MDSNAASSQCSAGQSLRQYAAVATSLSGAEAASPAMALLARRARVFVPASLQNRALLPSGCRCAAMRLKWSTLTVDAEEDEPLGRRRRPRPPVVPAVADAVPTAGRKRVLFHLIAGAVAGATAKTVEAPLDRVKIIFQVSKSRFSFRAAARQMVAIASAEGVQGLWKGNGTRSPRRRAARGSLGAPLGRLLASHRPAD